MNNTNNVSARMSFDIARNLLYKSWIGSFNGDTNACWNWVDGRKLSQSEIRCEVKLNVTNTNFTFGVVTQQPNSSAVLFPTEKRLNLQDSLIVAEYGIFVGVAASDTDSNWLAHTYGNPNVFTTSASFAAIDGGFYSSGGFQMTVNNDTIIPYRGLLNHYYRPQTQQIAAIAVGAVGDQLRGAEDAMITQEPNLILVGSKNYVPQIVLPAALAAITPGTRAVLIFRGVLAQNSTVIN
jgi:hypothetical protein